jgi:hypothetical protein
MLFRMISRPVHTESAGHSHVQHTIQRRRSPKSRWSYVFQVYTPSDSPPVLDTRSIFGATLTVGDLIIYLE